MTEFNDSSFEEAIGNLNELELKNSPKRIYYLGDITLLRRPRRVSIVGSREASSRGLEAASKLARELAKQGIVVVSGLARGVDTAALKGAMETGGSTIAVIGTPLNEYYPKENKDLQDKIAKDHLLISQFAIGTPSKPSNFPIRNRTMALISDATIIVEAKEKSGTLHQGWEALRLGRPLWILESVVNDSHLTWPEEMIKYGALIWSKGAAPQFLEMLPASSRAERAELAF